MYFLAITISLVIASILTVIVLQYQKLFLSSLAYIIIPINVLADVLIGYFPENAILNSGEIRVIVLLPLVLFFVFQVARTRRLYLPIICFLAYCAIVSLTSSEPLFSYYMLTKIAMGMIAIVVGYESISNLKNLVMLLKSLQLGALIIIASFVVAQFLRFGASPYFGTNFFIGGAEVQITYILAFYILATPLIHQLNSNPKTKVSSSFWLNFTIGLSLIVCILVFKRSTFFAIIIGWLVHLILVPRNFVVRRYALSALVFGSMALIIALSVYSFQGLFESRFDLDKELQSQGGRVYEFEVMKEPFQESNILQILIGTEPFNSANMERFRGSDDRIRPLHIDWSILLFGTGIIGAVLYLWIYSSLVRRNYSSYKRLNSTYSRTVPSTGISIVFASLVFSISVQMWIITSMMCLYLMLGALFRIQMTLVNSTNSIRS